MFFLFQLRGRGDILSIFRFQASVLADTFLIGTMWDALFGSETEKKISADRIVNPNQNVSIFRSK